MFYPQIHLSFSLDRDPDLHEESKAESEGNIIIRAILNILNHFATIIGNAKDAELKLVDCHALASSSGQFNGVDEANACIALVVY